MPSSGHLIGLLVLVGVLIGFIKFVLPILFSKAPTFPYRPVALLTPAELSFMQILEQAVGSNCRVLAKVRLGDVIDVKKEVAGKERFAALSRIQRKHIDFLICDPDYSVLCAVELDDSSHEREDRQERDEFVNKALWSAGITVVHFTVKAEYSVQEVSSAISKVLHHASTVTTTTSQTTTPLPGHYPIPSCPICGAVMVRRTAKSGANVGQEFWGCPNYPKCKGIVNIRS